MRACTFLVFAIIFVAVHSFSGHFHVIKPCLVRLATRRSAARTDTIDKPDAPSKPVASRKPLLLNTTKYSAPDELERAYSEAYSALQFDNYVLQSICYSQHQSWNVFYLQQTFDLSKQILDLETRSSKQILDLEERSSKQIHDLEIRSLRAAEECNKQKNILKMEYAKAAEVASYATIRFAVCRYCFSDRVG
jgi:hypothetical protein